MATNYENTKNGMKATRELKSDVSSLCKKCNNYSYSVPCNGGYGTHYCSEDEYDNNVLYYPFEDSYNNNACKVTECNKFKSKYQRREENSELNILLNKFMDKGLFIDYKTYSDLESGTYYSYSAIDIETEKVAFRGFPYGLIKELENKLTTLQENQFERVEK